MEREPTLKLVFSVLSFSYLFFLKHLFLMSHILQAHKIKQKFLQGLNYHRQKGIIILNHIVKLKSL